MAYQGFYTLQVTGASESIKLLLEDDKQLLSDIFGADTLEEALQAYQSDVAEWNHEDDAPTFQMAAAIMNWKMRIKELCELSSKYSELLFTLINEDCDTEEKRVEYYKNGAYQIHEIKMPHCDETAWRTLSDSATPTNHFNDSES